MKSLAPLYTAFAIALLLFASGCSPRESSSSEAVPPVSQTESPSVPDFPALEKPEDEREPSDMNIEQYRVDFARELLTQYAEPEMEAYGAIWYPNNQKLFFRNIPLENGGTRHLNVMQTTDTTGPGRTGQRRADAKRGGALELRYAKRQGGSHLHRRL